MSGSPAMECHAAAVALHGTMVEVFDTGVLLQGGSGSGKSDLALGLVDRGHRLVADDMVEFLLRDGRLSGSSRPGCQGFIEVRGLGIFDLARLYGAGSVVRDVPLGLVLTLETADDEGFRRGSERLCPAWRPWSLLGVDVAECLIPRGSGRDLPLLVETAVRLSRLWQQGYDGAAELDANLATLMNGESA